MGREILIPAILSTLFALAPSTSGAQEDAKGNGGHHPFHGVQINGLIQGWYQNQSGGGSGAFSLRRAELAFSGQASQTVSWVVIVDPSKGLALRNTYATADGERVLTSTSVDQGSTVLQDAFLAVKLPRGVEMRVGQFHVPLSMEGLWGSADLELVERALFISDRGRGGAFGDVRDTGVSFSGGSGTPVSYTVGVFNGLGTGIGSNGGKGFAGRFVIHPMEGSGIQFGASAAYADDPQRSRFGADGRAERGRFIVKSEVMGGRDGELHRFGFYGLAGITLTDGFQGVVRFDSWNPDTDRGDTVESDTERNVSIGINRLMKEGALKLQVEYLRRWFANETSASEDLIRINLQTAW